jgi:C1A family cysteine protease
MDNDISDVRIYSLDERFIIMRSGRLGLTAVLVLMMLLTTAGMTSAGVSAEDGPEADVPSNFNQDELGWVTSVKDQGKHGTCWSFGFIASAETSLISRGYADADIDLSEAHLAYFIYNYPDGENPDILVNNTGHPAYEIGGAAEGGSLMCTTGSGLVSEDLVPYSSLDQGYVDEALRYSSEYTVDFTRTYSSKQIDDAKALMIEGYGCTLSVYMERPRTVDDDYSDTKQTLYVSAPNDQGHSMQLVGWDDDYPAANFHDDEGKSPSENGAWLVKNSWGTDEENDKNGYVWVSYESSIKRCIVVGACPTISTSIHGAHNTYQYDTTFMNQYIKTENTASISNVYTAKEDEYLDKISFFTGGNATYTMQIYTGLDSSADPTDGKSRMEESITGTTIGMMEYCIVDVSMYRIHLSEGERFSIVLNLSSEGYIRLFGSIVNEGGEVENHPYLETGRSFLNKGDGWADAAELPSDGDTSPCAFRIRAYTAEYLPVIVHGDTTALAIFAALLATAVAASAVYITMRKR